MSLRLKIFDPETETAFLPEAIRRIVKSVGQRFPFGFCGRSVDSCLLHVEGKTKEGFATVKSFLYMSRKRSRAAPSQSSQATILSEAQIAAGHAVSYRYLVRRTESAGYEDFALSRPGDHAALAARSQDFITRKHQASAPRLRAPADMSQRDWRVDLARWKMLGQKSRCKGM